MPLRCSASSPAWTSSPMKERAHTSSSRNFLGQYEILERGKSMCPSVCKLHTSDRKVEGNDKNQQHQTFTVFLASEPSLSPQHSFLCKWHLNQHAQVPSANTLREESRQVRQCDHCQVTCYPCNTEIDRQNPSCQSKFHSANPKGGHLWKILGLLARTET